MAVKTKYINGAFCKTYMFRKGVWNVSVDHVEIGTATSQANSWIMAALHIGEKQTNEARLSGTEMSASAAIQVLDKAIEKEKLKGYELECLLNQSDLVGGNIESRLADARDQILTDICHDTNRMFHDVSEVTDAINALHPELEDAGEELAAYNPYAFADIIMNFARDMCRDQLIDVVVL